MKVVPPICTVGPAAAVLVSTIAHAASRTVSIPNKTNPKSILLYIEFLSTFSPCWLVFVICENAGTTVYMCWKRALCNYSKLMRAACTRTRAVLFLPWLGLLMIHGLSQQWVRHPWRFIVL